MAKAWFKGNWGKLKKVKPAEIYKENCPSKVFGDSFAIGEDSDVLVELREEYYENQAKFQTLEGVRGVIFECETEIARLKQELDNAENYGQFGASLSSLWESQISLLETRMTYARMIEESLIKKQPNQNENLEKEF